MSQQGIEQSHPSVMPEHQTGDQKTELRSYHYAKTPFDMSLAPGASFQTATTTAAADRKKQKNIDNEGFVRKLHCLQFCFLIIPQVRAKRSICKVLRDLSATFAGRLVRYLDL